MDCALVPSVRCHSFALYMGMASANSAGGVMVKMISLTSIAVASAATSMKREDESRLFRFTLMHSIFLGSMIGLLVMFYAYVMPSWAP